jgi:hypothetical protein
LFRTSSRRSNERDHAGDQGDRCHQDRAQTVALAWIIAS